MPKKNPVPVTPEASYRDYVHENLGVFEEDVDQFYPDCESDFHARADMAEGVGGLKAVDTSYENYSESVVDCPRSDWDDDMSLKGRPIKTSTVRHPAPRPMDLHRYPHRRT